MLLVFCTGDSRIELRADKTGAIRLTGVSTVVVKNAEQVRTTAQYCY